MESSMFDQAGKHYDNPRTRILLLFLAVLVAAATVFALTQKGQAMNHTKKVLDCQLEVHEHTDECYDEDKNLICGYADYVVHTHNDDCYDENGELVCKLPEIKEHKHTDDCYEEQKTLICGQEEREGHEHTDKCYEKERGELICGLEETEGHQHDEDCYDEDGELICDKEEEEAHKHTDECYEWEEVLTCGEEGNEGHKHTEDCYSVERVAVCGELEMHTHDKKKCYDEDGNLICGQVELKEHVHNEDCFKTVELDEEEVAKLREEPDTKESDSSEQNAALAEQSVPTGETDPADASAGAESSVPAEESTSAEVSFGENQEIFTKVFQNKEVEITAEYTAEANLPEEAELRAWIGSEEEKAAEMAKAGVTEEDNDQDDSVFYMIGFYVGDEEVEPQGPVSVKMRFLDGKFKDKSNLDIQHYAKDGLENITPQVQTDKEGNTEVVFSTNSFSLFGMATRFKLAAGVQVREAKYTDKKLKYEGCGVPGCNGKCNITWTIRSYDDGREGTARIGHCTDLAKDAGSYHIHDYVYYQGQKYQVTDISEIVNSHAHLVDKWNRPLQGKTVVIDDDLADKMSGNADFSLPDVDLPPVEEVMAEDGYISGERNSTSDAKIWKKAGYDPQTNQANISLRYYQGVKPSPSIDLVFVYDDTASMWDCCSRFRNGEYCAASALYQRAVIQSICKSIMNGEKEEYKNVRVAFVAYSNHNVLSSGKFFTDYQEAKAWLQSHFLKKGCTYYEPPIQAACDLIKQKSGGEHLPAVAWLADFETNPTPTSEQAAQGLRDVATGGVYTIAFKNATKDYGYSNEFATIDSQDTLPYEVDCCHKTKFDPKHMFLAQDMSQIFSAMNTVVKEVMGYYIDLDTVVWDKLSAGINALELNRNEGDGVADRYKPDPSYLYWFFTDQNGNRLNAGKLYGREFSFALNPNQVYSGSMPTNGDLEVVKKTKSENQIPQSKSPLLKKDVEILLRSLKDGSVISQGSFELYDEQGENVVWRGSTDENGLLVIPYSDVQFPQGAQYILKETSVMNPYVCPTGTWTLKVEQDYTITSTHVDWGDGSTVEMKVQKGRFVVRNKLDPNAPEEKVTYNVYWVKRNLDGTVTALSHEDDNWWGNNDDKIKMSVDVNPTGATHIRLNDSTVFTPDRLPTEDGKFVLKGYGIGGDFGPASVQEAPEELNHVGLEKTYSDLDRGVGMEWIRETGKIQYFQLKSGASNHTDEDLDGDFTVNKALYIIYEDTSPIPLTVKKEWNDGDETITHDQPVSFTITPQGGECIVNPNAEEGKDPHLFFLTAEGGWETTITVPRAPDYSLSETSVPGYAATYTTTVEDDRAVIKLTNIRGVELPSTGGAGTHMFTIGGMAILAGGLLYGLHLRRRREEAVD